MFSKNRDANLDVSRPDRKRPALSSSVAASVTMQCVFFLMMLITLAHGLGAAASSRNRPEYFGGFGTVANSVSSARVVAAKSCESVPKHLAWPNTKLALTKISVDAVSRMSSRLLRTSCESALVAAPFKNSISVFSWLHVPRRSMFH